MFRLRRDLRRDLLSRIRHHDDAVVLVALTPREARATARAIDLVIEVLKPHLFSDPASGGRQVTPPPLVTVRQVLAHACERADVDMDDPWLARVYDKETTR